MFMVLVINGAYVILSAFVVVISGGDECHKKKKKNPQCYAGSGSMQ